MDFSSDYLAFHPTTRLFTRLLGFAPDYWALHPTTALFIRLLGFHPTTGQVLNYWDFIQILGFHPNTELSPEYWDFTQIPNSMFDPNGRNAPLPSPEHSNVRHW